MAWEAEQQLDFKHISDLKVNLHYFMLARLLYHAQLIKMSY